MRFNRLMTPKIGGGSGVGNGYPRWPSLISHHNQSSSSLSFLIIIVFHLVCITIFVHLNICYVEAVDYWRKLGPLSPDLKLGTKCRNSLECLLFIPNSQCDCDKRCTCQPYHILYNQTMCLPSSLLGYACTVDEQCSSRVSNAECTNGSCRCKSNFLPLRRDKCLPPAMSGDFCINEKQCQLGNRYSQCRYIIPRIYGKCRCLDGYHSLDNANKKCLPALGTPCDDSLNECGLIVPNSHCAKRYPNDNANSLTINDHHLGGVCECKPGFLPSNDHLSCRPLPTTTTTTTTEPPQQSIQTIDDINMIDDELDSIDDEQKIINANAVSIGKSCNHTFECQLRDPYSRCLNGVCECIKPSDTCSSKRTGCYEDTFQCRSGQCISWYFVCDKNKNCDDGSDESDCQPYNCPKEAFQCDSDGSCLSRSAVCNGKWECPDGSDEARCFKGIPCDKHAWQCKSGQCLPQYSFCNAVSDCLDGSDEDEDVCENAVNATCPSGTFTCSNRLCRSTAILCSGVDGCGDNSDEEKCEACYCQKP